MSIIGKEIKCLDHGFITVMDTMGDDAAVTESARTSYGKGTKATSEDKGLINYLMRHHHTTPFEMCEIKLLCQMPIFIARQWVRHRTASINEYSMRYSDPLDLFYVPHPFHLAPQSKKNKQGRDTLGYDADDAKSIIQIIKNNNDNTDREYHELADQRDEGVMGFGLARELSRMVLPLNAYTKWVWKIDVNNLMKFLILRMDSHAQYEIRVYANAIAECFKEWMPWTYEAFEQHWLNAITFSSKEQKLLRSVMDNGTLQLHVDLPKPDGFSNGEYLEFKDKIKLLMERTNEPQNSIS